MDIAAFDRELAEVDCVQAITDLSRRRAQVAEDLAKAEAHWLEAANGWNCWWPEKLLNRDSRPTGFR